MRYQCELIHEDRIIELFFRAGESAQDVRDGLELFQWPQGQWRITAEDYNDNH